MQNTGKDIVLFDGTCKLCNNAVRFITRHDSRERYCFLPLESEKAAEYLMLFNKGVIDKGTVMLITGEKAYRKTDAVFRILKHLDGLWPLLYGFLIVPRVIRDPAYDLVSRYRYRLFGPCVDCPEYRQCC
jgi:predicted DCC family thiol-disulfide oxidoreductase YuxK